MDRTSISRSSMFFSSETPETTLIISGLTQVDRCVFKAETDQPEYIICRQNKSARLLLEKGLIDAIGPQIRFEGHKCKLSAKGRDVRNALLARERKPPARMSADLKATLMGMDNGQSVTYERAVGIAWHRGAYLRLTALGFAEKVECELFCFCETREHWRITPAGRTFNQSQTTLASPSVKT